MKKIICSCLLALAALHGSDGTLDTTFGTNGIASFPSSYSSISGTIFIDTDGKIYQTGQQSVNRFTSNGTIDTTFNANGPVPGTLELSPVLVTGLLIQPDGKVVVGGNTNVSAGSAWIMRYNYDGTSDQTFNNGQPLIISVGNFCIGLTLQADLKIVFSITQIIHPINIVTLGRLTATGELDSSFGNMGIVNITLEGQVNIFQGFIALTQDQKIVVSGCGGGTDGFSLVVIRCNADGSLDTSFNASGSQQGIAVFANKTIVTESPFSSLPQIIIQPNGSILVGFYVYETPIGYQGVQLARLTPNGALDTTFNGTGFSPIFNLGIVNLGFIGQILLQVDGNIVVACTLFNESVGFFFAGLVRYTSAGLVDMTFGTNGFATNPVFQTDAAPPAAALQADGKIILAAFSSSSGTALLGRFDNNHPFIPTTIAIGNSSVSGQAQSLGVVYTYQGGAFFCSSEVISNSWSCNGSVNLAPGTYTFTAVNQYPGGYLNLGASCIATIPQSALSIAVRNKYCPC